MLPIIAAEPLSGLSATALFELSALPCHATVLLAPDKRQHVFLRNAEHTLQLAVSGANILHPVCVHIEAIWPALVHGSGLERMSIFEAAGYATLIERKLTPCLQDEAADKALDLRISEELVFR
ncbi:hypothetical protein NKJ88_31560 [Mesorhizobium sp. M0016]|uniref:hypothetical protein n=1 Tax=Mesorhizobium sp. M0016 TaxID=2956843 RepID=UPI00333A665E